MGNVMFQPDVRAPEPPYQSKFDPMLGFPNGRKERTIKATKQEMESAAIPPELRDYCVDKYLVFLGCRREKFPFVYKCHHELHDYHTCEYEDHVIRMKEHEREKRLNKLAEKKRKQMEKLEN